MRALGILSVLLSMLSNALISQNDTMYIVKGGNVIGKHAISSYDSIIFSPTTLDTSIITDFDGNIYTKIIIGEQEWMAENLKSTKYTDGTPIMNVTNNDEWNDLEIGAWCYYDNNSQYDSAYGKLYNWYAASDSRNVCPTGWHVPTDGEWTVLTDYLGANGHSERKGAALKSISGWDDYRKWNSNTWSYDTLSGNGLNIYGWNGLPGGERINHGFSGFGRFSSFWSSSEGAIGPYNEYALSRGFWYNSKHLIESESTRSHGFFIRCLRDKEGASNEKNTSMYLLRDGAVIGKYATSSVDSIIFYAPTISVTDIDGNTYSSVIIGAQEWMIENLRTTKYADGSTISNVKDADLWIDLGPVLGDIDTTEWLEDPQGAWCHYNNDSKYDSIYGKLYNGYAVATGKLCPKGWHVPVNGDWRILIDYLANNGHGLSALKSTFGWNKYSNVDGVFDGNGTDNYGWFGLPGGRRNTYGAFYSIGSDGMWWHDGDLSKVDDQTRYTRLGSNHSGDGFGLFNNIYGLSVRCISDKKSSTVPAQVQERLNSGETPFDIYKSGEPIISLLGATYKGGLIAYLDTSDGTGLIAAPTENQEELKWQCNEINGVYGIEIGTGKQNTSNMLEECLENNPAYFCDTLTLGGFSDWFLPSKDELNKLFLNRSFIGFFKYSSYVSSSLVNGQPWCQNFNEGKQFTYYRARYVCAVRYF